jgi:hypothetical protein
MCTNCLQSSRAFLSRLLCQKSAVDLHSAATAQSLPQLRCATIPSASSAQASPSPATAVRRQVVIIRSTAAGRSGQLPKDEAKVLPVVLVTGGLVITIRYGTVFTNRTHHFIDHSCHAQLRAQARGLGALVRQPGEGARIQDPATVPDDPRHHCRDSLGCPPLPCNSQCHRVDDGDDHTCGYGNITTDLTIKNRDEAMGQISNFLDMAGR